MQNCCVIYHQIFLTYTASKSLKLSFTLNCVQKRANELTTISNWLVLLSTCFRNLKKFLMNKIFPETRQTKYRYKKYLNNLVFSVRTVSYGSSFFSFRRGKNSVHNLRYGSQTRLVRDMYWRTQNRRNRWLFLDREPARGQICNFWKFI